MQDADGPAHIQRLPQPAGACRPWVEMKAAREMLRLQGVDGIVGHPRGRRDFWQGPAVRPSEAERAVGAWFDLEALLVDRAVVSATEHGEVRERGRAPLRPVADVLPLSEREAAAREAAAAVSMVERSPQRRGDRPGPGPDLHEASLVVVAH